MGAEVKSMEIKKPQASVKEGVSSLKKVRNFIDDVKSEIFKINWTNRDELIVYTKIVVMTTFLFGMSIYLLDLLIQGSLSGLSFMLRWISG